MGAESATVPLTKERIEAWCSSAWDSRMRSTLFCAHISVGRARGRGTYLEDENVLELHDLDRSEVLRRLGLGAGLVGRNEEERRVHDGRTVQHGRHQNVVARTVDERDVSARLSVELERAAPTDRSSFILEPQPETSQGGWSSLSDE